MKKALKKLMKQGYRLKFVNHPDGLQGRFVGNVFAWTNGNIWVLDSKGILSKVKSSIFRKSLDNFKIEIVSRDNKNKIIDIFQSINERYKPNQIYTAKQRFTNKDEDGKETFEEVDMVINRDYRRQAEKQRKNDIKKALEYAKKQIKNGKAGKGVDINSI